MKTTKTKFQTTATRVGDKQPRNEGSLQLPELLTQEEAITLLRLDQLGLKSPEESLRYLRRTRQLGFVKVCGKILIPRQEIVDYLQRQTVPAMD